MDKFITANNIFSYKIKWTELPKLLTEVGGSHIWDYSSLLCVTHQQSLFRAQSPLAMKLRGGSMMVAQQVGSWPALSAPLPPENLPRRMWRQGGQGDGEIPVWEKQSSIPWTPWAIVPGGACAVWKANQLCWLRVQTGWYSGQKGFPGQCAAVVSQHAIVFLCPACFCLLPLNYWQLLT